MKTTEYIQGKMNNTIGTSFISKTFKGLTEIYQNNTQSPMPSHP